MTVAIEINIIDIVSPRSLMKKRNCRKGGTLYSFIISNEAKGRQSKGQAVCTDMGDGVQTITTRHCCISTVQLGEGGRGGGKEL